MTRKKGSILKRGNKWYARIRFVNDEGMKREIRRVAGGARAASALLDHLRDEAARTRDRSLQQSDKTFADLSDLYLSTELIEADFSPEGNKTEGKRDTSLPSMLRQLRFLEKEFGVKRETREPGPDWSLSERLFGPVTARGMKLESITYAFLKKLAAKRSKTKTRTGSKRTTATVNRELAMVRAMLNIAIQEKWLTENPFKRGRSLIVTANEKKRETILSPAEEARLLAACNVGTTEGRRLRAILILALDSGMRQGEIFKLRAKDVDFRKREIHVIAMNAKTLKSRFVPLTDRAHDELRSWMQTDRQPAGEPLFGTTWNVKRAYGIARKAAGVPHVRFHDLRHTAATRLIQEGLDITRVGKILGHSDPKTTYRYVNPDSSTVSRAATLLNQANERAAAQLAKLAKPETPAAREAVN